MAPQKRRTLIAPLEPDCEGERQRRPACPPSLDTADSFLTSEEVLSAPVSLERSVASLRKISLDGLLCTGPWLDRDRMNVRRWLAYQRRPLESLTVVRPQFTVDLRGLGPD
ncbi:hypothetical protein AAFF_G00400660 [Aldrovandia affinis]|uniref:Uncharacterized protein n=1 Tax=Aldrovandia affinis TaxID=143900 RepID=A0AAD7SCU8_9TELE|nr:hypothetical protein AAFF_G00400660 [Aldrovandia affinis]